MPTDHYKTIGFGQREVGFGQRPAIAVVDFQRGYIDAEFEMGGRPMVDAAVEQASALLQIARGKGIPVASCAMAYKSAADMPHWKITAMFNGEFFIGHPAVELDPRIYDPDYDFNVYKSGPSIFFSTPVHSFFTKHGVDTVIVCGCNTSGCIRASVIDSFSHGWRTIVPRECVGDVEQGPHDANLLDIQRRYADVLPVAEVIDYLRSLPNATT